jgi:hypothetical protein
VIWMHEEGSGEIGFHAYQSVRGSHRKFRADFKKALLLWSWAKVRPHQVLTLPPVVSRTVKQPR